MPTRGIYSDVTLPYLTYHQWCALPAQRAMFTHLPYRLPRYMLLDLSRDVIRSVVARFRLCVHTLCVETATWNSTSSPTCDLCEADDNVQV